MMQCVCVCAIELVIPMNCDAGRLFIGMAPFIAHAPISPTTGTGRSACSCLLENPWDDHGGWASEILRNPAPVENGVFYPIIYRVSTIQGGAGFLPPTVLC